MFNFKLFQKRMKNNWRPETPLLRIIINTGALITQVQPNLVTSKISQRKQHSKIRFLNSLFCQLMTHKI